MIVGAVQELEVTLIMPVDAAVKKVLFLYVAADAVLPNEPRLLPLPPKESVLAEDVNEPRLATTPVAIDKAPLTIMAAPNVFVPLPDKVSAA